VRESDKGALSEHKEGRAWDWMLSSNSYADVVAGQRVIDWLLADNATVARRLGIMYVIWNQRIWSAHKIDESWNAYHGESDHTDHIHFSFDWAGAEKRTSWWTGRVAPMEYGPCRKYIGDPVPAYGDTINLKPCPKPAHKPKPKPKHADDQESPTTPNASQSDPQSNAVDLTDDATPDPNLPDTVGPQATDRPGPTDERDTDPDGPMDMRIRTMPKGEPMPLGREPHATNPHM
jgi:hypothetical protein